MSDIGIMDASAILAYLNQEKGEQVVESALDAGTSRITTVNYCEVLGKLCEKGMPPQEAQKAVDELGLILVPFDQDLAIRAALLRTRTSRIGASLGDRACLALAEHVSTTRDVPIVYSSDRLWTKIKWPFKILAIR